MLNMAMSQLSIPCPLSFQTTDQWRDWIYNPHIHHLNWTGLSNMTEALSLLEGWVEQS
jgi:hypothetical protein